MVMLRRRPPPGRSTVMRAVSAAASALPGDVRPERKEWL